MDLAADTQAVGRFAPSPTGPLHLGNLRTALLAWLSVRSVGGSFVVRMEDLDRVTSSREHAAGQLADLSALGIDWDGEVIFQSERFDRYEAAIATLTAARLTYPCYCSRREIREAASAPHGDAADTGYPGTCRELSTKERTEQERAGRPPALRLGANGANATFHDRVLGTVTGAVDDVVLRRNDGVPAYNLAVVVDDAVQGVTEVVRGDDLASSTPGQVHLAQLLGFPAPVFAHVPLVCGPDGARLAKRHGAVTLTDLVAAGESPQQVLSRIAASLGFVEPGVVVTARELVKRFDWVAVPRKPWRLNVGPS